MFLFISILRSIDKGKLKLSAKIKSPSWGSLFLTKNMKKMDVPWKNVRRPGRLSILIQLSRHYLFDRFTGSWLIFLGRNCVHRRWYNDSYNDHTDQGYKLSVTGSEPVSGAVARSGVSWIGHIGLALNTIQSWPFDKRFAGEIGLKPYIGILE